MILEHQWFNPNWVTPKLMLYICLFDYTLKLSMPGMFTKDLAEKIMCEMMCDTGLEDN